MNRRYLVVTLALLLVVILGVSITSRSNLNPAHGVDYLFYGGFSDFFAQELTTGDFNNDGLDDIVVTGLWDNTSQDGHVHENVNGCAQTNWGRWKFTKGAETKYVCAFLDDDYYGPKQWQYWVDRGWTPVDTLACGTCDYADWMSVDNGAAYVFMGGSWTGKSRDNNLAVTTPPADHMIIGGTAGDMVYNGLGAGDLDGDGYDELVLGATEAGGALLSPTTGKVCVIKGQSSGNSWPSVSSRKISLPSDALVSHTFRGRTNGDEFGEGIVVGDLDDDTKAEIVVSAPGGDGLDADRHNSGEIYIFYSNGNLPTNADLSTSTYSTDSAMLSATSGYLQMIRGAAADNETGVTELPDWHDTHNHPGDYDPVGLAMGFWDNDEFADLAIGCGNAGGKAGAVYIFFGGPTTVSQRKLKPGLTLDLNASVGSSTGPDVKIVGKANSPELGGELGAGLAFVDADGQSPDDLIMGAPQIHPDGYTQANSDIGTCAGEAYLIFGDTRTNLTASGKNNRDLDNSGMVDVTIKGAGSDDQIGGHFSGKFDVDNDSKADVAIGGQDIVYLIFGQTRSAWTSSMDLATTLHAHPETRVLSWSGRPHANSTTIRLLDLNGDSRKDLVFGGYDLPGYGDPSGSDGTPQYHAGEMWVTKGADVWRHAATISSNTTWSGTIFLDGDIKITANTLTIAAGTDIWVWPTAFGSNLGGGSSTLVEIRADGGSLVIQGTEQDPVRIQAWSLEPQQTAADDSWYGIFVNDNSTATIDHLEIRNALRGIQCRSSMTLKNSTIEDCQIVGITQAGDSTNADSMYVYRTNIRRIGQDSGGIGVNILGKKAVLTLKACDIDSCGYGIVCYTKGALHTDSTSVHNSTTNAVKLNNRSTATLYNSIFESSGLASLKVYNASEVQATACTFGSSDYGAQVNSEGGSPGWANFTSCTFVSNSAGLSVVSGCEVYVAASQFNGNTDGIYDISAYVGISGSTFTNVTGIRLDDAGADIGSSILSENDNGLWVDNGSTAVGVIDSQIWNNLNGIVFENGSSAALDHCSGTCPTSCADGNSFKSNGKHIMNWNSSGTIDAECNYWGGTPTSGYFYGSVDYTPYLTTDPTEDLMTIQLPDNVPKSFKLSQNYPNPFNPTTTIGYDVPSAGGRVQIRVYNVSGQLVKTLVNAFRVGGRYEVGWNGTNAKDSPIASGVYFVNMVAPNYQATKKLVLLK